MYLLSLDFCYVFGLLICRIYAGLPWRNLCLCVQVHASDWKLGLEGYEARENCVLLYLSQLQSLEVPLVGM